MHLVVVDCSVDGVVDDVGVEVELEVPEQLHRRRQRRDRVRLLRADQLLQRNKNMLSYPTYLKN